MARQHKTATENNDNSKDISGSSTRLPEDPAYASGSLPVEQRKRGRPKGSKNKNKIIRQDRQVITNPGENTKYISHDLKLLSLPQIDMNNPKEMEQRITDYFSICSEDDIKPTVESFALSLGISRFTLFDIMNGRNKSRITNHAAILSMKKAYDMISSYYAHMMNNGRINPIAGIFLMKNNYGYKDTTEHVVTTDSNQDPTIDDIGNRAGLLTD